MPRYIPATVLTAAAATTTLSSQPIAVTESVNLAITITVTAVTGGGTVTPSLQWSSDGTNWVPDNGGPTFTGLTAAGGAAVNVPVKGPLCQVVLTLSGGTAPTYTGNVVVIPLASS